MAAAAAAAAAALPTIVTVIIPLVVFLLLLVIIIARATSGGQVSLSLEHVSERGEGGAVALRRHERRRTVHFGYLGGRGRRG